MKSTGPKGFTAGMAVFEVYGDDVATVDKPFGRALVEAASRDARIVGLSADLAKYTDLDFFAESFPERFFQLGMAEQNLIGVAAGLARTGFVPFAGCYCTFVTRRAYDFVAVAVAEGHAPVKIAAALPGITTGYGSTHQGIEDLALMRAIPNLTIIDPCDSTEIRQAVGAVADHDGPVYMRMLRGRVKQVFDPAHHPFRLGRAQLLRQGGDLAFISTGVMTDRALQVCEQLMPDGISTALLHVPTVKPIDRDAILDLAAGVRKLVTLENHTVVGGLGSAVCEILAEEGMEVRVQRVGIPDVFVECGSVPFLTEKYGLSVSKIEASARAFLES